MYTLRRNITFLLLLASNIVFSQVDQYYKSIDTSSMKGEQLKLALHNLISNHISYPYTHDTTDVWDILKITDRDTNNYKNVILVYSGMSVDANQEYNQGNGWEREHIWSASHGPFDREETPGTDLHHLKPVHKYFNRSTGKWARDFDDGGDSIIYNEKSYDCFKTKYSFEPRDEVKGDIARMIFYMAVCYEGDDGFPDLEIKDTINSSPYPNNYPYYGKLSTLLKWHIEDPVDGFEKRRHDLIYHYQKNRNPFIDNPNLVHLIWSYE